MLQAGLIDEIINDTLEGMEDEGVDEAADEEIDKLVSEITTGIPSPPRAKLPEAQRAALTEEEVEEQRQLEARVTGLKAT